MENKQVENYLGIARKAGYVIIGGEKLEDYQKKLYLVLYDESVKKNSLKIIEKLKEKNIPVQMVNDLASLIKIENCKIIGLKNKNLSDIILSLLN